MASQVVDILLQINANTAALTRVTQQIREAERAQREQAALVKRAATEQIAMANGLIQAEEKKRQAILATIAFQQKQVRADTSLSAEARIARENELLARQRRITEELIEIKRRSLSGQDAAGRWGTLSEIQGLRQGLAGSESQVRSDQEQRAADAVRQETETARRAAEERKQSEAEVQAVVERSIQTQMRRREMTLEAIEFEREQLRLKTNLTPQQRMEAENALLNRQRQTTQEIIALKRAQLGGQDELTRANTLREIQRLEQGVARAARDTAAAQRQAAGSSRAFAEGLSGAARFAAVFTGVQLSIEGLVGFARQGIAAAEQLGATFKNTADRLDTTSEAAQVLDFVFRRGGLSIDEAAGAAFNLNRRLDEARAGSIKAAEPFFRLGLSLEGLAGITTERRLEAFGAALAARAGQTGVLEAAIDTLGTKSERTLSILRQYGTIGFDRAKADALALGQLLDPEMTSRLEKAKRQFEDFERRKTIAFGPVAQVKADILTGLFGTDEDKLERRIRQLGDANARLQEMSDRFQKAGGGWSYFSDQATKSIRETEKEIQRLKGELDLSRASRQPAATLSPADLGAAIDQSDAAAAKAAEDAAARSAAERLAVAREGTRRQIADSVSQAGTSVSPRERLDIATAEAAKQFGKGTAEYDRAVEDARRAFEAANGALSATEKMAKQLRELDRDLREGTITQEQYNRAARDLREAFVGARTPAETYAKRVADLREAFQAGVISNAEFTRGLIRANEAMQDSVSLRTPLESLRASLQRIGRDYRDNGGSAEAYRQAMEDTIDAARTIKDPFEQYATSLRQITRLQQDGLISARAYTDAVKTAKQAVGSGELGALGEKLEVGRAAGGQKGRDADRAQSYVEKARRSAARGDDEQARYYYGEARRIGGEIGGRSLEEFVGDEETRGRGDAVAREVDRAMGGSSPDPFVRDNRAATSGTNQPSDSFIRDNKDALSRNDRTGDEKKSSSADRRGSQDLISRIDKLVRPLEALVASIGTTE